MAGPSAQKPTAFSTRIGVHQPHKCEATHSLDDSVLPLQRWHQEQQQQQKKRRHGQAQAEFIAKVHHEVATDADFFVGKDWRRIEPTDGRRTCLTARKKQHTDSFHVKSLAVWLPHKLFPEHVPECLECGDSKHVDTSKSRWIDAPVVLFGRNTHRHLDTVHCHCGCCDRRFQVFNKRFLQIDAAKCVGQFNFFLGVKGFAVDEELHSFIVHSAAT